ncbi:MAG: hypothetical protein HN380_11115 [Victivallales bacterium]|nr:hypothetical protein [Victivallales bacterium]
MRYVVLALLLFASLGLAADIEPLLPELQGKAPAQERGAAAWRVLHREVLAHYLPRFSVAGIWERRGPAREYQFIAWRAARPGAEVERQAACDAILARLAGELTPSSQLWLIKILQHAGREESVPVLAKFADAPEAGTRTWALRALAENPSGLADKALDGLLRDAPAGRLLERLVAAPALPSLVPVFAKHAAGEGDSALAAMQALGRTGSTAGDAALQALKPKAAALVSARDVARLANADRLVANGEASAAVVVYRALFAEDHREPVRCGALLGLLTADPKQSIGLVGPVLGKGSPRLQGVAADYLRETADEKTVLAFASALPRVSVPGQVLLLGVFAARQTTAVRPTVIRALDSKESQVRVAAARALASLGDVACISRLLTLATGTDDLAKQANASLQRLAAPGIDAALLAEARNGPADRRAQCVDVLTARRAEEAVPTLMVYAKATDKKLSGSACKGLALLAKADDLPALVGLLVSAEGKTMRRDTAKATLAVARRSPAGPARTAALLAALPTASPEAQVEIVGVLGELGGDGAFAAVLDRLTTGGKPLRDAALRAFGAWPDASPAEVLLKLAKTEADPVRQVLALRGCVRALGQPGAPAPAVIAARLGEAMAATKRDDERKVVLAGLGQVRHASALALLRPYLENPTLKAEAVASMLKVAVAVCREDRKLAEESLALIVEHADAGPLREQAEETKRKIEEFDGFVVNWLVAGPFFKTAEKCAIIDMKMGPEGKDAATVEWQLSPQTGDPAADWEIPFQKIFGGTNRVAYAATWIRCAALTKAKLEIGSDDAVKVWVDDKQVHRNDVARPVKRGEDVVEAELTPGWHRIMLKVTQGGGGWGACLRLRAADGGPLPNWRTLADFRDLDMVQADVAVPAFADSARRALAEIVAHFPARK